MGVGEMGPKVLAEARDHADSVEAYSTSVGDTFIGALYDDFDASAAQAPRGHTYVTGELVMCGRVVL